MIENIENLEENQEVRLTKKQKRELKKKEKFENKVKKQKNESLRKLFVWLGVGLAIVLFLWWAKVSFNSGISVENPIQLRSEDLVKGFENAEHVLIEYADFQCPACRLYSDILKEVGEQTSSTVKIVYRHFPLNIHPNARDAARASEAAARQGKFWEMYDLLYAGQSEWSDSREARDVFLGYAEELDLDKEKYLSDFNSKEVDKKIDFDYASGLSLGVNGTPTFFLDGKLLSDMPTNVELFKTVILDEIKQ